VIPILGGAFRLTDLSVGTEITPENARYVASPLPVVVHIIAASGYCVLGAFQFPRAFRAKHRGGHRVAGRVLVLAGIITALSGLWMTLIYPRLAGDGDLLAGIRVVVGSAMVLSIVLGFAAIRRRNFVQHRAWMIRAYAIAQGAGTQALTQLPIALTGETPTGLSRTLLLAAAWVINIALAEVIIRSSRRPVKPARIPSTPKLLELR
jgi:uncharacterized membrane protein